MPKRKSSDVEELNQLKKRLKLLEGKMKKPHIRRRRIQVIEDTSSSSDEQRQNSPSSLNNPQDGEIFGFEELFPDTQATLATEDTNPQKNLPGDKNDNNLEISPDATSCPDVALDNIILDVLHEDPTIIAECGKEVHNQLTNRLEYFATNGLTKDNRKELVHKYLIPSNCVRIGAPELNAEIKAALPENLVKRDKTIEARQKILAKAISCLASAVTDELSNNDKNQDLLRKLMDTRRLLCDLQYAESRTRRNFALFSVKKDLREHLANTKIDKYLFGENLSEALKTAKAVSKSGTDLKPSVHKKPATAPLKPPTKNFNWKPPILTRRQQGSQRSREHAPKRQPPSSSKPSQRPYGTNRRQ